MSLTCYFCKRPTAARPECCIQAAIHRTISWRRRRARGQVTPGDKVLKSGRLGADT